MIDMYILFSFELPLHLGPDVSRDIPEQIGCQTQMPSLEQWVLAEGGSMTT